MRVRLFNVQLQAHIRLIIVQSPAHVQFLVVKSPKIGEYDYNDNSERKSYHFTHLFRLSFPEFFLVVRPPQT